MAFLPSSAERVAGGRNILASACWWNCSLLDTVWNKHFDRTKHVVWLFWLLPWTEQATGKNVIRRKARRVLSGRIVVSVICGTHELPWQTNIQDPPWCIINTLQHRPSSLERNFWFSTEQICYRTVIWSPSHFCTPCCSLSIKGTWSMWKRLKREFPSRW